MGTLDGKVAFITGAARGPLNITLVPRLISFR